MRHHHKSFVFSVLATTALAAPTEAGALKVVDTTFGWDKKTETITEVGSTPLSQYPAIALNEQITVDFSDKLKKKTVDPSTVRVTTIDSTQLPSGLTSTSPGGQLAAVDLKVKGDRLIIRPAILPTDESLGFGYVAGTFYRLELIHGNQGIKGKPGNKLKNTIVIEFRAIGEIADTSAGPPVPKVSVIDAKKGNKVLDNTKINNVKSSFNKAKPTPPPKIRFKFDELVVPTTVVNPATQVSPTLKVEIDADGDGKTIDDRTVIPGAYTLTHTVKKSTVTWKPTLQSIPANSLYVITVDPLIEDLNGNSVFTETGDIGAIEVFGFRTTDGDDIDLDPIEETFDTQLQRDPEGDVGPTGACSRRVCCSPASPVAPRRTARFLRTTSRRCWTT